MTHWFVLVVVVVLPLAVLLAVLERHKKEHPVPYILAWLLSVVIALCITWRS
jgi:hypothetical protein